ncbi:hypothetical protein, partial [Gordonia soli]|uniref:hypothetical protein n=1 Tax=Gordonia soli TaxID=320799 RepID=UPI001C3F1BAC
VWQHSRKGRIEGEIVWQKGEWIHIRLTGDHHLRFASEANRGRVELDGSHITVRRSLLTPAPAPDTEDNR